MGTLSISAMTVILLIAVFTFLLNLPFGYIRGRSRRFSPRWFICVHMPVPFVIAIRLLTHTDYKFIPLFILVAVAGQVCGGRIMPAA
jgi:hypothetical protein